MNSIVNSPTVISKKEGWMVFLAGPMKASPRGWRNKLVKKAGEMGIDGVTFLSPRFTTMHQPSNQVQWETQGLRMCDIINLQGSDVMSLVTASMPRPPRWNLPKILLVARR